MIEFQISDRKTGKTTHLLEWLVNPLLGEKRFLVEPNQQMVDAAFNKAKSRGMNVTLEQFVPLHRIQAQHIRGIQGAVLGIDNLDLMLFTLMGGTEVARVAATGVDILHGGAYD